MFWGSVNTKVFILPNHFAVVKMFSILLWLVALVSSCASVQVSQDYDTNFAFDTDNTYGWNIYQRIDACGEGKNEGRQNGRASCRWIK